MELIVQLQITQDSIYTNQLLQIIKEITSSNVDIKSYPSCVKYCSQINDTISLKELEYLNSYIVVMFRQTPTIYIL